MPELTGSKGALSGQLLLPSHEVEAAQKVLASSVLNRHSQTLSGLIGVDSRESRVQSALKSRY